ncbi:MAG: isocitrate lyase, partial [Pseudomonadota bacterium]
MTTGNYDRATEIARLTKDWAENPRWKNVTRSYDADDVVRLRGSVKRENTLARRGAEKLWALVNGAAADKFGKDYVNCLGALTGGQAVQQVKAGV